MLSAYHRSDLKQREGIQGTTPSNTAKAALAAGCAPGKVSAPTNSFSNVEHARGVFNLSYQGDAQLTTSSCSPPGSRSPCAGGGTAPNGA